MFDFPPPMNKLIYPAKERLQNKQQQIADSIEISGGLKWVGKGAFKIQISKPCQHNKDVGGFSKVHIDV